jgi:hypothetical protein
VAVQRGVGIIFLVVVAGLIVGSLLGDLLGSLLPHGTVRDVISKGPTVGLTPPATVDLHYLAVTFGLRLKINLIGILGIVIAAVTLRKL